VARAAVREIHALVESRGTAVLTVHCRKFTISMKIARILDEGGGSFRLEYDNARGHKQSTRLDAVTYEQALRETKSYLEIGEDDRDAEGGQWDIE
jgi:hypothetical protein